MGVELGGCRCMAGEVNPEHMHSGGSQLQGSKLLSCTLMQPQRPGLPAFAVPRLQDGLMPDALGVSVTWLRRNSQIGASPRFAHTASPLPSTANHSASSHSSWCLQGLLSISLREAVCLLTSSSSSAGLPPVLGACLPLTVPPLGLVGGQACWWHMGGCQETRECVSSSSKVLPHIVVPL